MTIEAVVTMIGAMLLLWGGLVVSIVRLRRYPEMSLDSDEPGADATPRSAEPPPRTGTQH